MKAYPKLAVDGGKLVLEDVNDGWSLAGTVDDQVRAQFAQIPVSGGDAVGWIVPVVDGPIAIPAGASGAVSVNAFTAYRGPSGAGTTQDLLSAFFSGSTETVPTPLPTAGNHRWDLLYAIISETDSTSESRIVENPTTEAIAGQTLNTKHESVVTLAWVQGTSSPTATDPYPAGSWPALPTPAAGEAHVPLAYVHVHYSATPATVTYSVDRIFNAPRSAKINPQTGAESVGVAGLSWLHASTFGAVTDVKTIITTQTSLVGTAAKRTPAFIEPAAGGHKLWIPIMLAGSSAIGSAWSIVGGTGGAIITPDTAKAINPHNPLDLLNRWFRGQLFMGPPGVVWAHDQDSTATDCGFPTSSRDNGGVAPPDPISGLGNTIRKNPWLDAEFVGDGVGAAGDWYCAAFFRDVLRSGADNDLALVVRRVTSGGYTAGAMHVAAREAVATSLDGKALLVVLDVAPQFFAFNL